MCCDILFVLHLYIFHIYVRITMQLSFFNLNIFYNFTLIFFSEEASHSSCLILQNHTYNVGYGHFVQCRYTSISTKMNRIHVITHLPFDLMINIINKDFNSFFKKDLGLDLNPFEKEFQRI